MFKINLVNLPSPLKIKMDYKFPEVLPVKLQKKEVQPRTVSQLVYPDSGFNGLSEVSINAVTNEIDENIKSENIKKDVSILGVQGNVEELKGTKLEITKNGTYIPEEPYNAFTEVDVATTNDPTEWFNDTISAGNGSTSGVSFAIKKIPEFTFTGTDAQLLFAFLQNIIEVPNIDISMATHCGSMFYVCKSLKSIPQLNISNCKNTSHMFASCSSLTTIPLLDTSKVEYFDSMFENCTTLTEIPPLDTHLGITFNSMFYMCKSLIKIPLLNFENSNRGQASIVSGCNSLTTLGGFQNLGKAYLTTASANYYYYELNLSSPTKLTHDSLMNVINNLYDIATKGCKTQRLILGSKNLAKLTAEEIAIATSRGWSVS